jgi:predicted Kef-type K+ transport protein
VARALAQLGEFEVEVHNLAVPHTELPEIVDDIVVSQGAAAVFAAFDLYVRGLLKRNNQTTIPR